MGIGSHRRRPASGILWIWAALLTVLVVLGTVLSGCLGTGQDGYGESRLPSVEAAEPDSGSQPLGSETIDEGGSYSSKEEVARYLHTYGRLPDNYITKEEARKLGWDSREGNLWEVAPGKSIGGSRFGNYEGMLPQEAGREYFECDIEYSGGRRGAKRIVYSNDGLVYYTEDHYRTFEELKQ